MAVRLLAPLLGLVLGIVLFFIGAVYGLNGEQYAAWTLGSWILAGVVAAAGLAFPFVAGRLPPLARSRRGVAAVGAALSAGALVVMRAWFADPYEGSLVLPSVLAAIALIGALAIVAAAFDGLAARAG